MKRSFYSFFQYHGKRFQKPLAKWGRTLLLGAVLCLLIGFLAGIQGKQAWVTSGALWEIAVILLGWSFFAGLAKIIDGLAKAKEIVLAILRSPSLFFRFVLIAPTDLPTEDPVRSFTFPPPAAPSRSHND